MGHRLARHAQALKMRYLLDCCAIDTESDVAEIGDLVKLCYSTEDCSMGVDFEHNIARNISADFTSILN